MEDQSQQDENEQNIINQSNNQDFAKPETPLKKPFQDIDLSEEDQQFLKFLEAKLSKTEQKIITVQKNLEDSAFQNAKKAAQKADELIQDLETQYDKDELKKQLITDGFENNYVDMHTKCKQMQIQMEILKQEFLKKNNQINYLLQELRNSQNKQKQQDEYIQKLESELSKYTKKPWSQASLNNNVTNNNGVRGQSQQQGGNGEMFNYRNLSQPKMQENNKLEHDFWHIEASADNSKKKNIILGYE